MNTLQHILSFFGINISLISGQITKRLQCTVNFLVLYIYYQLTGSNVAMSGYFCPALYPRSGCFLLKLTACTWAVLPCLETCRVFFAWPSPALGPEVFFQKPPGLGYCFTQGTEHSILDQYVGKWCFPKCQLSLFFIIIIAGYTSGLFKGHKYFHCNAKHGIFIRPRKLHLMGNWRRMYVIRLYLIHII